MERQTAVTTVCNLMQGFASGTGIADATRPPRRYLWTDAFAVCNFLELAQATGEARWHDLALALVAQVHDVLGRHRGDDGRSGWISGLGESEGRLHPTAGGLRIGKKLAERRPAERFDERLEWDRDGQYFHYLTKWMHALCRVGAVTGDATYTRWAAELMRAAQGAFVHVAAAGSSRMVWKMSIDLTRPQVASMGHHDPLDGLITAREVQRLIVRQCGPEPHLDLSGEISAFEEMCKGRQWATDDPLGLGGLLFDAGRVLQMMTGDNAFDDATLVTELLGDAVAGLNAFAARSGLNQPAEWRLAFRELGLSIGLNGVARMQHWLGDAARGRVGNEAGGLLDELARHHFLAQKIEEFWLQPHNRDAASWREHADINAVMLATSLMPDGFLTL